MDAGGSVGITGSVISRAVGCGIAGTPLGLPTAGGGRGAYGVGVTGVSGRAGAVVRPPLRLHRTVTCPHTATDSGVGAPALVLTRPTLRASVGIPGRCVIVLPRACTSGRVPVHPKGPASSNCVIQAAGAGRQAASRNPVAATSDAPRPAVSPSAIAYREGPPMAVTKQGPYRTTPIVRPVRLVAHTAYGTTDLRTTKAAAPPSDAAEL